MKTLKDILNNKENFDLSETKYNVVIFKPEQIKKEGGAVIYRVYKISDNNETAHATNTNAWGVTTDYLLNTEDLKPL